MIKFNQTFFLSIVAVLLLLNHGCGSKAKKESSTDSLANESILSKENNDEQNTPEDKLKKIEDQNKKYKELTFSIIAKDDTAVEKIASQLLTLNVSDVKTLNAIGLYHASRGRFALAEMILNKALKLNDKTEVIYSSLGWLQFQKGNKRDGIRFYKKSLEINPDYLTSLINLGSYFAETKDYGNARYLLETAYKKSPTNLSLLNNYAVTLMALGEQADDIFEAGLKLNSTGTANVDFLINYSIYLIRIKKNYVKGKEILNKINFIGAATDRKNVILNLEESIKR